MGMTRIFTGLSAYEFPWRRINIGILLHKLSGPSNSETHQQMFIRTLTWFSNFFMWQEFRAFLSSRWDDIDHWQLSFSNRPNQRTILYFGTHIFETFVIPVIFVHRIENTHKPVENMLYFCVVKLWIVMWSWFKVMVEEKFCHCYGPPNKSYAPCQWQCLY